LHSDYRQGSTSKVYVTDYTIRADLAPVLPASWWDDSLENRIVRIDLRDEQSEKAQTMKPGTFFRINNLNLLCRVKGRLSGLLGGNDNLITKLNLNNSSNVELAALLECVSP
jgi:hypothetical protein